MHCRLEYHAAPFWSVSFLVSLALSLIKYELNLLNWEKIVDRPIAETSYKDGLYESTLCRPSNTEMQLYASALQYANKKTIREVMTEIVKLPDASDEALLFWIGKRLTKTGHIECIDLSCIAPYNEMWGFKVAIDSAEALKKQVCMCDFVEHFIIFNLLWGFFSRHIRPQ